MLRPAAAAWHDGHMERTVAVLNQKGGVGKTTVTLGFASAAAAAGRRVLVVDLDPQAASSWVLGIEPGGDDLAAALLDKARSAYESARERVPDNLGVLENLGVIYANQGDYKKAVWQWAEVLKRQPNRQDIIERIKRLQRVTRRRAAYVKRS